MLTFEQFLKTLITEDLHPELKEILDSEEFPAKARYNQFLKKVKKLDDAGIDTGLLGSKPKKGSSRAVFFPRDHPIIQLDSEHVELPVVYKMAMHGALDKYRENDEPLLGEDQNQIEGDDYINNQYGMIRAHLNGEYSTNPNGILPPTLEVHPDYHHLIVGQARNMTAREFSKLTRTPKFPKGLIFTHFYDALNNEYSDAHGFPRTHQSYADGLHDKIMDHPFVQKVNDLILLAGLHPADLKQKNMGIWQHPITQKEYPVLRDYGCSTDIARRYSILRKRRNIAQGFV